MPLSIFVVGIVRVMARPCLVRCDQVAVGCVTAPGRGAYWTLIRLKKQFRLLRRCNFDIKDRGIRSQILSWL
jgi:hypothetical protein